MGRAEFLLRCGSHAIALGRETRIMAILNVTPDSFSDGGRYLDAGRAAARARRLEAEGAHLLDIGGESSRPGSRAVSAREEIRRIRPVLKRLRGNIRIPISVDTYKYDVAAMALDEGAVLINDIYALRGNRRLARLIARYRAGVVLMHMQGTPATMQKKTLYRNFFAEITASLRRAMDLALACGIARDAIVLDPGFGFGKTAEQNLRLLSGLDRFSVLKFPLLAGLSRKSFIGHFLAPPGSGMSVPPGQRLYGSLAAAACAIGRGAHILRVHEVLPHRHLAAMMDAIVTPERK